MNDEIVLAKARAAALWCNRASSVNEDKPWSYMLVPHDAILGNMTLSGLAAAHTFTELPLERTAKTP
jgi:type III restriction enzyme